MSDVRLLTDSRATTSGIIGRLGWLLTGLHKDDRILFHYSGHGAQMPTRNPQGEVDGLDEVICPVDFDWTDEHVIRDKDFARLFRNVPDGVEFIWISDSCHSGDLTKGLPPPHQPQIQHKALLPPADINWRLQTAKSKEIKAAGFIHTARGLNVALVAGCRSDQTSDASFNNRPNGALTYFLLQELRSQTGLKEKLTKVVGDVSDELKKAHFEQQPQLEGSPIIMSRAFLGEAAKVSGAAH